MKKISLLIVIAAVSVSLLFSGCAPKTSAISADQNGQEVALFGIGKKKQKKEKVKAKKTTPQKKQAKPAVKPSTKAKTVSPQAQSQLPSSQSSGQNPSTAVRGNPYVSYSQSSFAAAKDFKRVLYFYAAWCPTCKAANAEITNNSATLPQDVVVFRTDYDTEAELKKKYNITYQHTFVYVDQNGNPIKKWNGGNSKEIIANTK